MITLGINAAFHDSSAALVRDGQLIAAAEEERFTRIKHGKRPLPFTAWELPYHAIDYCLAEAGLTLAQVDHVAYSYDPQRFIRGRLEGDSITLPLQPSAQPAPGWDNPWDPLFAAYVSNAPRQLADGAPHHLKKRFKGCRWDGPFQWHFIDHHLCHQASAFLAAPFERCAVMTLDGRGEDATTAYGLWADGLYRPLGEVDMPHSLGLLYERVTSHLGFLHSSDEYKVMALAALGKPRFAQALQLQVRVFPDGRYEIERIDLGALVPPRERGAALEQPHLDLAASLQQVLERSALQLAGWLREASGEPLLAMAGGVALNCVMNARLRDAGLFDQVWVQPAAGDAGTALGAALWVDAREGAGAAAVVNAVAAAAQDAAAPARDVALASRAAPNAVPTVLRRSDWAMEHAYWGPGYGDDEIAQLLKWAKLTYRRVDDVAAEAAQLLAQDLVIGWFQGRMEFGPRALGARSILASPLHAQMQARINELKDREDFRPVAPAVPEEDLGDWFTPAQANGGQARFMLFIYDVIKRQAPRIPAACHADLTARVQTVTAEASPRYHALLKAFGALTGVPVLINTSFNVRGEPVVCTPKDALDAFFSTPLDALVMGNFILRKG
ncbi:carbamoyltransferase family protein [Azohydromonas lata]|uniref:Carbamoyltransferase C-terminal domain-containing protein n=1 Tax=Azohydromonas lata TaxID=45677 RepID=A0ABU5IHY5_9BURK|nr:carbamoyltransferase C-terminal domain-containing protein [Azohydromonas lata]MDZ5458674.1 carbamoyltransferase C-terminal domain-containing protein [Azohydromonas lata]